MSDLTSTELTLGLAAGLVGAGYLALIVMPAWRCYGRVWERIAASFLTLFMLATLLGPARGSGSRSSGRTTIRLSRATRAAEPAAACCLAIGEIPCGLGTIG